jgi:hypothetical protein
VPEFAGETSSATEAKESTLLPGIKELAEVPATEKMEEPRTEKAKTSEVLSPSAKIETGKSQKGPTVTPKRKRMVNVLDVLETIKSSSITPKKTVETSKVSTEAFGAEASKQQFETEAGPSEPTKVKPFETEETNIAEAAEKIKISEPILVEETDTAAPEAPSKIYDYIVRHASGKKLTEEEIFEANHYARELKYPNCWGLVLKCYELRTRQHKMLNINILRPSKHYFPKDIMIFGRRLRRTHLHKFIK